MLIFTSCRSQTTIKQQVDTSQSTRLGDGLQPNYNYTVEVPQEWTIRDTTLSGIKLRFLLSPQSLNADHPMGNILIASMEGRNIDEFTTRNMNYLRLNMPGTTILDRGNIETTFKGQWFTYTKTQNGMIRDMINYIIPINGYAYMITCGSNKGTMERYRVIFDKIAKSLKN